MIDKLIKQYMNKVTNNDNDQKVDCSMIKIYYQNQMHTEYKTDEKVVKKILHANISCKDSSNKLNVVVYYKNAKSKDFVMKNNLYRKKGREIDQSNIIYEFKCPEDECVRHPSLNNVYIGHTTCTLSRRLSLHLQNGAIKMH